MVIKMPDWLVVLLLGPALPSVFIMTGTWHLLTPTAVGILTFANICFCHWILKLLKSET